MPEAVRRIDACRLCGGESLMKLVDFGAVPLGNNLQKTLDAAQAADSYPLQLDRCGQCGHFQLGHAVAPELLYATNYTYLSGIGPSFVRHFEEYSEWAESRGLLRDGGLVVDVGSNDGTCLKAFQARGYRVCGVDPASLPAAIANEAGVETINAFFDSAAVAAIIECHGQADFVTSHNVLAHVDDLAETFRNVYALLKDRGFFAFEIGYFREVLRNGFFDTIYHEHLDYHHAAPLARHLTGLGFDVIDLSVNAIQGGSLRLLLQKTGGGQIYPEAEAFLADERDSVLYDEKFLADWFRNIDERMSAFGNAIRARKEVGATVAAYGAPTKATLLTKIARLGAAEIDFVVEDNPLKIDRFLPGSGIPIKAVSELADAKADTVVLFAWNFADDILAKLRGRFDEPVDVVVPLPQLRIVTI